MKRFRFWAGVGLLILALVGLFYTLSFFIQLTFTPWDTALTQPEIGTWQRSLNDFFESGTGALFISIPLVIGGALLAFQTVRRNPSLVGRIAMMTLGFILLIYVGMMAAYTVNNAIFPYPPVQYDPNYIGYHRAVLPGLALFSMCAVWLGWQKLLATEATTKAHSL